MFGHVLIFDENFDFGQKFWVVKKSIFVDIFFIFDQCFIKISTFIYNLIFDQNFDFYQNFKFYQNFDLWLGRKIR